MMFRKKTATAALALLAITLAGCAGAGTDNGSSPEPMGPAEATLLTVAAPGSLDPAAASLGPLAAYFEAAYDTLLRVDAAGDLQPWLAEEWEYDAARTTLTLSLRDDVAFIDDSTLSADVVVANLNRFKAGTAPNAGRLAIMTEAVAVDETTVEITLAQPDPNFLLYLASDAGLVASGEALDDPDLATSPVGSGAYILEADGTVIGSSYRFVKNPDYWNPDVQHFDELTIQALPDVSAIVNAVSAGEADIVQLPKEAIEPAEKAGWTVEEITAGGFAGIIFLDRDGEISEATGNEKVRQAVNFAMDRPTLIKALNGGIGTPTTQVFPLAGAAFDAALDEVYPHDPEKAKELLAEAGYPDGVTISLPDFGNRDNYAIMEQMFAEAGISIEWVEAQLQNSITDILTKKFSAVYFALGEPTDWGTIQQIISPTAGFNPFRTQDPELDALIATMQTGDEEAQAEAAREINEYIVDAAWFAPIQTSFSLIGVGPDVTMTAPTTTTYPSIFDIQPK